MTVCWIPKCNNGATLHPTKHSSESSIRCCLWSTPSFCSTLLTNIFHLPNMLYVQYVPQISLKCRLNFTSWSSNVISFQISLSRSRFLDHLIQLSFIVFSGIFVLCLKVRFNYKTLVLWSLIEMIGRDYKYLYASSLSKSISKQIFFTMLPLVFVSKHFAIPQILILECVYELLNICIHIILTYLLCILCTIYVHTWRYIQYITLLWHLQHLFICLYIGMQFKRTHNTYIHIFVKTYIYIYVGIKVYGCLPQPQ